MHSLFILFNFSCYKSEFTYLFLSICVLIEIASLSTANRDQTLCVPTPHQPPPLSAGPPNRRNRALRHGKENICLPGGGGGGQEGGDPYEAFARTERSKRDKRRPEWNTQR